MYFLMQIVPGYVGCLKLPLIGKLVLERRKESSTHRFSNQLEKAFTILSPSFAFVLEFPKRTIKDDLAVAFLRTTANKAFAIHKWHWFCKSMQNRMLLVILFKSLSGLHFNLRREYPFQQLASQISPGYLKASYPQFWGYKMYTKASEY